MGGHEPWCGCQSCQRAALIKDAERSRRRRAARGPIATYVEPEREGAGPDGRVPPTVFYDPNAERDE